MSGHWGVGGSLFSFAEEDGIVSREAASWTVLGWW